VNNGKLKVENGKFLNSPLSILHSQLLVFPMQAVLTASTAELIHLKPVRRVLFVLGRHVVTLFALSALQNYVISRHKSS
jgi:hypothetical protein